MKKCYNTIKKIYNKYKVTFMYSNMLLLLMAVGGAFNTYLVYEGNKTNARDTLNSLMSYGDYVDMNKYCRAVKCKYIYTTLDNTSAVIDIDNDTVTKCNNPPKYIIHGCEIYLPLDINDIKYYIPVITKNTSIIIFNLISVVVMFIIIILMVNSMLVNERTGFLSSINNKEEYLRKDIVTNIALNINHELNSLLIVIKSLLDDIKYIINKDLVVNETCKNKCFGNIMDNIHEILEDVDDAETALDNMYGIVRVIGDFKSIENSNGNKNIPMLINASISIVKISNKYTIDKVIIDDELNKYSIYHEDGFTNGAFSNIIINHIKNSIEAHTTNLEFKLISKDEKYLYIDIIDDGDGIPNDIKNKIFDINITTKADVSKYERGVGMYINRIILEKYHGADDLKSTEVNKGTTFTLKIKYEKYKLYNEIVSFK